MQCMLSLNDCLTVGSIQINVLEVGCDWVSLGITDPNASPVYRVEILTVCSEDDDTDGTEAVFEPLEFEQSTPFAISVR